MFDVTSTNVSYRLSDVPPVLVLGVVGGLFGAVFNFLLTKVLRVYSIVNE